MAAARGRPRRRVQFKPPSLSQSARPPPPGVLKPSWKIFDIKDFLLFVSIVGLITIAIWASQNGTKESPAPSQSLAANTAVNTAVNTIVNNTADIETFPFEGVVIASVIFVALVLLFVTYLLATGKRADIKRLSPFFGIAGFFVAAGGFMRLYPSEWSNVLSSVFVITGYSLAILFTVKEFQFLPWDRRAAEDELEKQSLAFKNISLDPGVERDVLEFSTNKKEVEIIKELEKEATLLLNGAKLAKLAGKDELSKSMINEYLKKLADKQSRIGPLFLEIQQERAKAGQQQQ